VLPKTDGGVEIVRLFSGHNLLTFTNNPMAVEVVSSDDTMNGGNGDRQGHFILTDLPPWPGTIAVANIPSRREEQEEHLRKKNNKQEIRRRRE